VVTPHNEERRRICAVATVLNPPLLLSSTFIVLEAIHDA